jgi:hypothetical protein
MRVPRVRFTVRRMMVAVAILALIMDWAAHLRASRRTNDIRSVAYRSERVAAATLSGEAARNEAVLSSLRADGEAAGGPEKAPQLEQLVAAYRARIAGLRREAKRSLSRAAEHARWERVREDAAAYLPWRSAVGAMRVVVCGAIVMGISAAPWYRRSGPS